MQNLDRSGKYCFLRQKIKKIQHTVPEIKAISPCGENKPRVLLGLTLDAGCMGRGEVPQIIEKKTPARDVHTRRVFFFFVCVLYSGFWIHTKSFLQKNKLKKYQKE